MTDTPASGCLGQQRSFAMTNTLNKPRDPCWCSSSPWHVTPCLCTALLFSAHEKKPVSQLQLHILGDILLSVFFQAYGDDDFLSSQSYYYHLCVSSWQILGKKLFLLTTSLGHHTYP